MTASAPTLLAEVGGTNVRFGLAWPNARQPLDADSVRSMLVVQFDTLADAAATYLRELDIDARPQHAVFAVAGRLDGDDARLTNHPWTISFAQTRRALGLASHRAINDFAAMSLCLPLLAPHDSVALGAPPAATLGSEPSQTFAVLGPGTGLGVGALLLREGRMFALQTEGGHIGVAPCNALEIEVLKVLQRRFGRVSVERLLCGQGLVNLEAALVEIEGRSNGADAPDTIAAATEPRHRRTLEVFCGILGATAGDFVLGYGAWHGAWIAGGLVPHLLPWLRAPGFRTRFEDKGRFADAMRRVPVRAVVHPHPALLGAAVQSMLDAGHAPLPRQARPVPVDEEIAP
ncbi:glucokinase [Chiayiivirga flava]|uniref:Glucokinase n=1 Tax=Chiayiivirga flava TaxID=659595 RepID=A0A7W8DBA6_9GAMM|nr:glucokinase [Chiayiivirga flava]MBB5209553.1 glucokinase [Chiayiivirga flava]